MDHGQLSMVVDKFQWVFSASLLNACMESFESMFRLQTSMRGRVLFSSSVAASFPFCVLRMARTILESWWPRRTRTHSRPKSLLLLVMIVVCPARVRSLGGLRHDQELGI